jgi:hypothetical protein
MMAWLRNPWGRPRFLPLVTGLYIFWSVVPVVMSNFPTARVAR